MANSPKVEVDSELAVDRFPALIMTNVRNSYWLSRSLFSLNDQNNRMEYLADRDRYIASQQGLSQHDRDLLTNLDLRGMYEVGISIYLIRSLCLVHGIGFVETGVATGGTWPPQSFEGRR